MVKANERTDARSKSVGEREQTLVDPNSRSHQIVLGQIGVHTEPS